MLIIYIIIRNKFIIPNIMDEKKNNYLKTIHFLDRYGKIILLCKSCKIFEIYKYDSLKIEHNKDCDILKCRDCGNNSIIPITQHVSIYDFKNLKE